MNLNEFDYETKYDTLILKDYNGDSKTIDIDLNNINSPIEKIKILSYCFSYSNIEKINIDNYLKLELENYAFINMRKLKEINLPRCIKTIPVGCFRDDSSLTNINLKNIETIKNSAFKYNNNLSIIDAPNCKTIEREAFANCTNLKRINLQKLEFLGEEVFYDSIFKIIRLDNIKEIKENAFRYAKCDFIVINNECTFNENSFINCTARAINILKPINLEKDSYCNRNYSNTPINTNDRNLVIPDANIIYRETTKELEQKGFDCKQINQIMKAYENGIFLSNINNCTTQEDLRLIREMYKINPSRTQHLINELSKDDLSLDDKISIYKKLEKIKPKRAYKELQIEK